METEDDDQSPPFFILLLRVPVESLWEADSHAIYLRELPRVRIVFLGKETNKHMAPESNTERGGERGRKKYVRTAHGALETPFFMPDATRASVRGIEMNSVRNIGIEAAVVNTYHLMLHPGSRAIAGFGGVHRFMGWDFPVLSDSGGYQVYSLIHKHPDFGKITEDGAIFRSPLDGSKRLLTPEKSIDIQFDLGVDMMVCLDDPRPNDAPQSDLVQAVERTIRWARRCKDRYEERVINVDPNRRPLLFGVVQGGLDLELRRECASELGKIGFDGYGFGARHIDNDGSFLEEVLRETAKAVPETSLRFALGVGTPMDIVRCYRLGWDMFDCVIPTREGRHGRAFVWKREMLLDDDFYDAIRITGEQFSDDLRPIDSECDCPACRGGFSRAYIRYLFSSADSLGSRLVSLHNLRFYAQLLQLLRTGSERVFL